MQEFLVSSNSVTNTSKILIVEQDIWPPLAFVCIIKTYTFQDRTIIVMRTK